jgi:hypothetical protein
MSWREWAAVALVLIAGASLALILAIQVGLAERQNHLLQAQVAAVRHICDLQWQTWRLEVAVATANGINQVPTMPECPVVSDG